MDRIKTLGYAAVPVFVGFHGLCEPWGVAMETAMNYPWKSKKTISGKR